jgi:hypothetical protein
MLRLRRLFPALGLVVLAVLPAGAARAQSSPPVDQGLGMRLLEAPSNRQDDPRARRYIVDHVAAGTTFSRAIEVTNGTGRDITVGLYAAAANLANGDFVPAEGHTANELSGWMKLDPPTLQVPNGGRAQAKITIAVPADATPGERYAVALAELPPPPGQGLVGLASRVGIRVYLSVGPGAEPATDFQLQTFQPINEGGKPGVAIHSCNTGGRALDLGGSLKLANGPAGISAGPFTSSQPSTIAPGDCEDLKILLDPQLPRGPWDATASLRSGTKEKEATARITFPAPGQKGPAVKAHEKSPGGLGVLAIAALSLVAVALLAVFLLSRRRKSEPAPV